MRHSLLLAECARMPWAMRFDYLQQLAQVVTRWSAGQPAPLDVMEAVRHDAAVRNDRKAANARAGGGAVAVLSLYGVIMQREIEDISGPGSTSTQRFTAMLRSALAKVRPIFGKACIWLIPLS